MAVKKYRTKAGLRYLVEVYKDGARIANRGGFKSRLEALEWERQAKKDQTSSSKQPDLALYEVATLYLLESEQRRKKNTIIYKKTVLRNFIEFCGKDAVFKDVDRVSVKQFISLIAKNISPKSANKYRVELSALWAWAQKEGHSTGNPPRQVEPFPVTKHVRYIPPPEHISKAIAVASEFQRDFINALLHTAGRISELRELAWEDVDFVQGAVRLWTSKRRGGDREPRRIAISSTFREILERLFASRIGGEVYVFTNPLTGTMYTRQSTEIKHLFQDVCKKAEIPMFTAHSLRHFVATHFKDPRRAQVVLGHMNIRTTEIYLHDLGVDMGVGDIFDAITNKITNRPHEEKEKGPTVYQ